VPGTSRGLPRLGLGLLGPLDPALDLFDPLGVHGLETRDAYFFSRKSRMRKAMTPMMISA